MIIILNLCLLICSSEKSNDLYFIYNNLIIKAVIFLNLFIYLQTNPNNKAYEKELLLIISSSCIVWNGYS